MCISISLFRLSLFMAVNIQYKTDHIVRRRAQGVRARADALQPVSGVRFGGGTRARAHRPAVAAHAEPHHLPHERAPAHRRRPALYAAQRLRLLALRTLQYTGLHPWYFLSSTTFIQFP